MFFYGSFIHLTPAQAALLAYVRQGEEAAPMLEAVLAGRLALTMYKTLSKEDKYEAARTETTLAIAKWIKVVLVVIMVMVKLLF